MARPGRLYVCGTPIGTLEDITLRVLRILREVDFIAAEDTRRTRKLVSHYDIHTPLLSYHEHNKHRQTPRLLDMIAEGKTIALVSDAGMPGISDPGHELISQAVKRGIEVVVAPGPSAVLTALVLSGFPTDRFRYEGFLPRRRAERRTLLESLRDETAAIVVFESPHRISETLSDISAVLGDRQVCLCRELTKCFEEVLRGTAEQVRKELAEPRGEITLVIAGAPTQIQTGNLQEAVAAAAAKVEAGESVRDAVRDVAERTGISRSKLYSAVHERQRNSGPPPGETTEG